MTSPTETGLSDVFAREYQGAYAVHGDLDLEPMCFAAKLRILLESQLGSTASIPDILNLLNSLYAPDLYLSIACVQSTDTAWRRFLTVYENRILQFATFITGSHNTGLELAENVTADLFLPDASGNRRLASYDGRRPLMTWLNALVRHSACNQRDLKWNSLERIDNICDVRDSAALARIDSALIARRYEAAINDSFAIASASLTERERSILLLRYDKMLQVSEIAGLFAVHPSTITRQLQQTQSRLGKRIIRVLASKHQFGHAAIRECLGDILENPRHSLMEFLKVH